MESNNISFSKNGEVVSIFKLDITQNMPFHFEPAHTVVTTDILGKPVEKIVYGCEIGSFTIDVCNGDFIVIGKKGLYLNGMMKEVEYVEAHTQSSIQKNFGAYDELEQRYVDDILTVFDNEIIDEEPSYNEIKLIEDNELEELIFKSQHLTIEELLDDED